MNKSIQAINENKNVIFENWIKKQALEEGFRDETISEDQRAQSWELLDAFLDVLNENTLENPTSRDFDPVQDILSGISVSRAKQGFSPRETSSYITALKESIMSFLAENSNDLEAYVDIFKLTKIFDHLSIFTFESYIKGREEVIMRQTDEITEISTPVIRVWDGILALPIIGTLDSARTQTVMENLLQEIVETGSPIAILDISGVPAVDSLVAQHLIKTVGATRLMGAECIISGIRPEIAQTVVHLGIDLSNIITKATLASALKTAFNMLQLQVVKQQKFNIIK